MIRFLGSIVIVFATLSAQGQKFPSELWHEGELVLLAGDTLKGIIKYNLETDIIQYKPSHNEPTARALTGRNILFFEIFDSISDSYRQFYALPYHKNVDYQTPVLFEVVYEGKQLSLLSREAIEYQVTSYPYATAGSYSRLILDYTYYFLESDGKITEYTGKRRDLIWAMNKRSAEIRKFMKTNRIRSERRTDLVKTVSYYNSLFNNSKKQSN